MYVLEYLSHATLNIMDSSVQYVKDASIDDATTTPVVRFCVCYCSAHGHEGSPYKHSRTSVSSIRVISLFTIIVDQLENAVIKTVICVNLNNGHFEAITNVALNATTRKVPLSNDCVRPGLGTTNDWSLVIIGRMPWCGHCHRRYRIWRIPGLSF